MKMKDKLIDNEQLMMNLIERMRVVEEKLDELQIMVLETELEKTHRQYIKMTEERGEGK